MDHQADSCKPPLPELPLYVHQLTESQGNTYKANSKQCALRDQEAVNGAVRLRIGCTNVCRNKMCAVMSRGWQRAGLRGRSRPGLYCVELRVLMHSGLDAP